MIAVATATDILAAAAGRERRIHMRLGPEELSWIREVRLKYGPKVSLIDLSPGGALLQTDVRLRPGSDMVLEIVGARVEAVPMRVLRSQLARISADGAIYQGACEFKRPLDIERAAALAASAERADLSLRKLATRQHDDGDPAAAGRGARELPHLLRAMQAAAKQDDPLNRSLRDLLSDLVPGLERGEAGPVLRARLEERLRRTLPGLTVAIGPVPSAPRPGTETIYFGSRADEGGVITVEMPEGTCMPDWHFRLLQAGGYLLEMLPAGAPEAPGAAAASPDAGTVAADGAATGADINLGWQKVVVRYREGRLLKGFTHDFHPSRTHFTLWPAINSAPSERMHVPTSQLKAVFFVRDFNGNPNYTEGKAFEGQAPGRRIEVTFADHEVLLGSTLNYRPDGVGFFVLPADSAGNNLRVFVVGSAIQHVRFV